MRPFEFPIPLRVFLRKLCAPIQSLRLQRRDPPLVPSQAFLRLQQRPQPRRIRVIAPEFRITSRFQVIQPDDFRVARRAAAAAARRRLRLLTVCASFESPSRRQSPVIARVVSPASSRPRGVGSRVGPRRSAPLPFAFAFAFALDVAVALTPRVALADDVVARDVDARLATSRATRRHMFRDVARRALTRRRVDRHYARVVDGVVVVARARRRARASSARTGASRAARLERVAHARGAARERRARRARERVGPRDGDARCDAARARDARRGRARWRWIARETAERVAGAAGARRSRSPSPRSGRFRLGITAAS